MTSLDAGARLAHYRISAAIGAGGMGEVYRATDTRLGREVALKVLPAEMAANPERLERFRREARALAALDHPGIVTVYSVEEAGGVHFLTMQLVEGQPLDALIPEGGMPVERLVAVGSALADALAAAHEKGIVHRDLKPANVMVTKDGRVKVLDFGLAKLTEPEDEASTDSGLETELRTREGVVMGTMPYMSPEQVEGRPLDHRSDLFSMGVVLYEMATGRRPFRAASAAGLVSAILRDEPPRPARPDVPEAVHRLIEECLRKDPARRVQTAGEVRDALAARPDVVVLGPRADRHTVGRRAELDALRAALQAARAGRGSLVCVTGEPGIGKTTLVEGFLAEATTHGACTVARGRCSERLAGSDAYLPVLGALDSLRQGSRGAAHSAVVKRTAPVWYAQIVPPSGQGEESARLLDEIRDATPERLKREFVSCVKELAGSRPLVLFLDDLHWADVSTVDLLSFLAGAFDGAGVLVIATYRPSDMRIANHPFLRIRPDLQARGLCRELALEFLHESEIADYLALEFPGHRLPPELPALVHARTEGNPLFMADLLRYLRDQGAIAGGDGGWTLAHGLDEIRQGLPESVRGMIERKIAQLGEDDRALLSAASVQGHVFDSAVVAGVLGLAPDDVEERLERLERVHAFVTLVSETELPDHTLTLRYRFVHALYQNALYASLRATRRATLSREVARALERFHGEKAPGVAHELASLFEAGREFDRAAEHYLRAAGQASRVFADREAASLAARGLASAGKLPASPGRDRLELELQLALGVALRTSKGFGHADTGRAYARARELCEKLGETRRLFPVLFGLWEFHQNQGELEKAVDVARQMIAMAEADDDPGRIVAAHGAMADNLLCLGDPVESSRHAARAAARYDPGQHEALASLFGYDPGVAALSMEALALWQAGYPEQALRSSAAAADLAKRLAHPPTQAFGTVFSAWVLRLTGSTDAARQMADESTAIAEEFDLPAFLAFARVCRGWIAVAQGEAVPGAALAREAVDALQATGFIWARSFCLGVVAEGYADAGRVPEAAAALDGAFDHARRTGERFYEAELLRLRGELLLRSAPAAAAPDAERCYLEAIDLAERQRAKSWELRAATSLARLRQEQGRPDEACELLSRACSWFTEGEGTGDLERAKALLRQLAGADF